MRVLTYPFTEEQVRSLHAGETVKISGRIYTGRDRLHKYLAEGGACPVDLQDGALFHCGPVIVPEGEGWHMVAAGPTTSVREEPYMAGVIARCGVRIIIGKGGMGARTQAACSELGCVYLQAVGGAASLLAQRVRHVDGVDFLDEFGATEALWHLTVDGLEAVVGMDAHGRNLFDEVRERSAECLKRLLEA